MRVQIIDTRNDEIVGILNKDLYYLNKLIAINPYLTYIYL